MALMRRHGAFSPGLTTPEGLLAYENKVGAAPLIVHFYRDFGDRLLWPKERDLLRGRTIQPMVTWEPYDVDLDAIATGHHDRVIAAAAEDIAAFGATALVRFAHEMNGAWYPWHGSPFFYRRAWRRIAERMPSNARMVWCPNVLGGKTVTDFGAYWPGAKYVHWTGLDGYNWGEREWKSPAQVFLPSYRKLQGLAPKKPMILAETSCAEAGGSKSAWIDSLPGDLVQMPKVKAVCWFDKDMRPEGQHDWRVDSSPTSLQAYRRLVS